ncbi:MAG: type II toxin-antitoxin system HicA family toxin [Bacteroidetes bacterium]|nr:type II toxin-antitoxin system HicA family toxin [Bacteroidota bacterium]
MSTRKLKNISPDELRAFLKKQGCKCTRTTGGHEHWTRSDLTRPLTFSSHIDPVPEFVVKNLLRLMGLNKDDFFA